MNLSRWLSRNAKSALWRVFPLVLLASLADAALLCAVRILMKILDGDAPLSLPGWFWGTVSLVVLRWAFSYLRGVSVERAARRVEMGLSIWFARRLRTLSPQFFHRSGSDERLSVAFDSIRVVGSSVESAMQALQAVLQLVVFLPVLFVISPKLTLAVLAVVLPVISFVQRKMHAMKPSVEKEMLSRGEMRSAMESSKRLFRLWSSREELSQMVGGLFSKARAVCESGTSVGRRKVALSQGMEALSVLSVVGVLTFCAWMILSGSLSAEGLILYCSALFLCYKPVKECARLLPQMRLSKSAKNALEDLEREPRKRKPELHAGGFLEFSRVDFSYGEGANFVFRRLDLSLAAPRPVLLRGPNGCGKSTFLKLISGLEEPVSGGVRLPKRWAADGVFSVSQDLILPSVEFVRKRISAIGGCPEFRALYRAVDGDRLFCKTGLSGGERAKVALLWAAASPSKMILLDEPFAFVAESERAPLLEAFLAAAACAGKWVLLAVHDSLPERLERRFEVLNFENLKEGA